MNNIECITNKPVAFDSPDHICPVGAKNDNTSNLNFVKSVEKHFQRKINYLESQILNYQLNRYLAILPVLSGLLSML